MNNLLIQYYHLLTSIRYENNLLENSRLSFSLDFPFFLSKAYEWSFLFIFLQTLWILFYEKAIYIMFYDLFYLSIFLIITIEGIKLLKYNTSELINIKNIKLHVQLFKLRLKIIFFQINNLYQILMYINQIKDPKNIYLQDMYIKTNNAIIPSQSIFSSFLTKKIINTKYYLLSIIEENYFNKIDNIYNKELLNKFFFYLQNYNYYSAKKIMIQLNIEYTHTDLKIFMSLIGHETFNIYLEK